MVMGDVAQQAICQVQCVVSDEMDRRSRRGDDANKKIIYPGDSVKNVFSLDQSTGKWFDNWIVTPGRIGNAAGQVPFGGGLTIAQDFQLHSITTIPRMTVFSQRHLHMSG